MRWASIFCPTISPKLLQHRLLARRAPWRPALARPRAATWRACATVETSAASVLRDDLIERPLIELRKRLGAKSGFVRLGRATCSSRSGGPAARPIPERRRASSWPGPKHSPPASSHSASRPAAVAAARPPRAAITLFEEAADESCANCQAGVVFGDVLLQDADGGGSSCRTRYSTAPSSFSVGGHSRLAVRLRSVRSPSRDACPISARRASLNSSLSPTTTLPSRSSSRSGRVGRRSSDSLQPGRPGRASTSRRVPRATLRSRLRWIINSSRAPYGGRDPSVASYSKPRLLCSWLLQRERHRRLRTGQSVDQISAPAPRRRPACSRYASGSPSVKSDRAGSIVPAPGGRCCDPSGMASMHLHRLQLPAEAAKPALLRAELISQHGFELSLARVPRSRSCQPVSTFSSQ